jgi:hypothetical protein
MDPHELYAVMFTRIARLALGDGVSLGTLEIMTTEMLARLRDGNCAESVAPLHACDGVG